MVGERVRLWRQPGFTRRLPLLWVPKLAIFEAIHHLPQRKVSFRSPPVSMSRLPFQWVPSCAHGSLVGSFYSGAYVESS